MGFVSRAGNSRHNKPGVAGWFNSPVMRLSPANRRTRRKRRGDPRQNESRAAASAEPIERALKMLSTIGLRAIFPGRKLFSVRDAECENRDRVVIVRAVDRGVCS